MKKQGTATLLLGAAAVLLMLRREACAAGVRAGIQICGAVLIPSLFPFSVLTALWIASGSAEALCCGPGRWMERIWRLPAQAVIPLAAGLVGGYPIGAQSLAQMVAEGRLEREDGAALSAFCNNPGPAFLIGAVGAGVLEAPALGTLIWGICLAAALLTGRWNAGPFRMRRKAAKPAPAASLLTVFPAALWQGVTAMLRVCGTVVLFSGLRSVLEEALSVLALPEWLRAAAAGAAELTTGALALRPLPLPLRFVLASSMAAWGGVCVHLQAAEALLRAGLPLKAYLIGKLKQTAIAALLALCLVPWLFPEAAARLAMARPASLLPLLSVPVLCFKRQFAHSAKNKHWKMKKPVL